MNKLLSQCIFFLLISFSFQQYEDIDIDISKFEESSIYLDMMNCFDHENTETCSSVSMKSGIYQCCTIKITYYGDYDLDDDDDSEPFCSIWVSSTFSDEQIKSMEESYQEALTFFSIVYNEKMPEFKTEYKCPGKTYTFNYGKGSFTQEELDIIKDPNYCLRLYYNGLYKLGTIPYLTEDKPTTITKEVCMNGKTLPNSKNSCAYASFNFKFYDGTSQTISTCLLASSASFETKSLDKLFEDDFKKYSGLSIDGKTISSFETEITGKDGSSLKYDSLTQTVTSNSSGYLGKFILVLYGLLVILF